MNFTLPVSITDEQIGSLLCSAFEGGVARSWCRIITARKPRKSITPVLGGSEVYSYIDYPLHAGGRVTCRDVYKEDETDGKFTPLYLDREAVERGLRIMSEKHPRSFSALLVGDDDACTGDVFLQCALLGKVVYG